MEFNETVNSVSVSTRMKNDTDELDIEEFINLISDPDTKKIFNNPILTENGETREFNEFIKNNKKRNISYMQPVIILKAFINSFLEEFPEYKDRQYQISSKDNKLPHAAFQNQVSRAISHSDFKELMNYSEFFLKFLMDDQVSHLFGAASNDTIKYFIDNCCDVNETFGSRKWCLLNWMCSRIAKTKPELIKYIIETREDLNLENECGTDKWRPSHQIINFSTDNNLVKLIIDKNADLFAKEANEITSLELLFQKRDKELIDYALSKINPTDKKFLDIRESLINRLYENITLKSEEVENILNCIIKE